MGESIIIKEKRSKVLLFNNLQWQHCSQVKNGCIVICPYVCQSKAHHKTNLLEPLVRFPGIKQLYKFLGDSTASVLPNNTVEAITDEGRRSPVPNPLKNNCNLHVHVVKASIKQLCMILTCYKVNDKLT